MLDPSADIDVDEIDFDHTDESLSAGMYPALAGYRETCPVLHGSRFGGFWALTRYDDVAAAADDPAHFTTTHGITIPPLGLPVQSIPLTLDPPEHGRYRRVLQPAFTSAAVRRLEPEIRQVVREHVDALQGGRADLVAQLAVPVPPIVIAMILGVDRRHWRDLKRWTDEMTDASYREDVAANRQASQGLLGLLHEELARRREDPGDDLLTAIAHCTIEGEEVADEARLGMVEILLVAGHETTVRGIGSLLHHLLTRPDLLRRVMDDPALLDKVIDESLRYESPVFGLARTVVDEVEVCGRSLPAGDRVLLMFGSANHDPRHFDEPEVFNPERPRNPHLAFGYGRHRCLGEHLAKLEMRLAVEELFARLPDCRLEADAVVSIKPGLTRGPRSLPVVWNPGDA